MVSPGRVVGENVGEISHKRRDLEGRGVQIYGEG